MADLFEELDAIPKDDDFSYALDDLMTAWRARNVGLDGVEAILAFIEAYPDLDYGAPGALVHFAEEYYRRGYEAALLRSFARRPTILTAWMVNRVLNGMRDAAARAPYLAALGEGAANPAIDAATRAEITHFLERAG